MQIALPIVAKRKNKDDLEVDILKLSFKWLTKVGTKKSKVFNCIIIHKVRNIVGLYFKDVIKESFSFVLLFDKDISSSLLLLFNANDISFSYCSKSAKYI